MTHLLLRSSASQVDYGLSAYTVRGERLFFDVGDIVTYLIVTCDDKTVVRADQCVRHQNVLHATFAFVLEVMGLNVVMRLELYYRLR